MQRWQASNLINLKNVGNILLLSASGQLILTFLEVNDSDSLQGRLSDLDHSDACMPKIDRPNIPRFETWGLSV